MDLAEYYEEVTKTAGLKAEVTTETEIEDEKVAAVVAVAEQFEIDGIEFDSEDEKLAAAVAIVQGFDSVSSESEKDAGVKDRIAKIWAGTKDKAGKVKEKAKAGYDAAKAHLQKHKGKYQVGGAAAAGAGLGFAAGRKSKD